MFALDITTEAAPLSDLDTPIALPHEDSDTWKSMGRCNDGAGTLSSLFFSEDLIDIARAKAICSKCPVAEQCLQAAVDRREPWGVWGGQLFQNGKILAKKRKRGRPPKHPVPELVVDEVPIPPWIKSA